MALSKFLVIEVGHSGSNPPNRYSLSVFNKGLIESYAISSRSIEHLLWAFLSGLKPSFGRLILLLRSTLFPSISALLSP